MFKLLSIFLFLFLIEITIGDSSVPISYKQCGGNKNICQLHQVRVNPCSGAPCVFRRGTNSTIEFDFTPVFDARETLTQASAAFGPVKLPMPNMDREGCKFTTCPLQNGVKNTYRYPLYLASLFPPNRYNVVWELWDAENGVNTCCFEFKMKLI